MEIEKPKDENIKPDIFEKPPVPIFEEPKPSIFEKPELDDKLGRTT